jgi:hypothetical protein
MSCSTARSYADGPDSTGLKPTAAVASPSSTLLVVAARWVGSLILGSNRVWLCPYADCVAASMALNIGCWEQGYGWFCCS